MGWGRFSVWKKQGSASVVNTAKGSGCLLGLIPVQGSARGRNTMVLIDFPKFRTHKFMIASLQLIFLQGYERLASRVSLTGQKKDSGSGETTISIPWAWELRPQMSKCAQNAPVPWTYVMQKRQHVKIWRNRNRCSRGHFWNLRGRFSPARFAKAELISNSMNKEGFWSWAFWHTYN